MFYGAVVWDPWLIVSQIVCLQCLYYLTLGFFMSVLVGTRVSRMSLVYFFDFSALTISTGTGLCVIASFLLSALAGAGYILYLIERAKKCLDFSATLYVIHLFICIVYGGWPSSITWWVVNGTCVAVMALLGEWLCIRRELKEIPITRYRSSPKDNVRRSKERLNGSSKGEGSNSSRKGKGLAGTSGSLSPPDFEKGVEIGKVWSSRSDMMDRNVAELFERQRAMESVYPQVSENDSEVTFYSSDDEIYWEQESLEVSSQD